MLYMGGIYCVNSAVRICHNQITGNTAIGSKGADGADAVYIGGQEGLPGGGGTSGGNGLGGGVYCDGAAELSYNLISNNTAAGNEGGRGGRGGPGYHSEGAGGGSGGSGGIGYGGGIYCASGDGIPRGVKMTRTYKINT